MKLKFESNQQYQLDAINAVVDIFTGQPKDSDGATRHMDQDGQLSLKATIASNHDEISRLCLNGHRMVRNVPPRFAANRAAGGRWFGHMQRHRAGRVSLTHRNTQ